MTYLIRRFLLLTAVCACLSALLFVPGLGGGFILDDKPTITENNAVQIDVLNPDSLTHAAYSFGAGGGSRALPMLSFALDYSRAGLDPVAFKTTNLLIHALTTLALAFCLRLLLGMAGWPAPRAAIAALALALAWGIHPLQVSSVLYVVQRMQTLSTLFLVLGLWAYLKMRQAQIDGQRSRQHGVLAGLCWALALASKEDAVLLPVYTLALELTVLRFRAASPALARSLQRSYLLLTLLGTTAFVLVVLPHYWTWGAFPGRDFSSLERLMTQGRVLAMYLWQIVLPIPSHMPFYYDDLVPSRGLLQPWTTLPSLLLIIGLLILAWRLRTRRPLFALGVFLFFSGHFISSNVIGLELAFEHRNHFPLIGAMLAISDVLAAAFTHLQLRPRSAAAVCVCLLAALGAGTLLRAQAWGTPLGFGEYSTRIAPYSERAWINLCQTHFELSDSKPGTTHFDQALAACSKGATIAYGATNLTNLVLLKAIDGSIQPSDWDRLFKRMQQVTMTPSNAGVAWHLVRYSNRDNRIDPNNVVRIIDIVGKRAGFRPEEYAAFGYYAAQKELDADAYRYFVEAVQTSPPRSTLPMMLVADVRASGYLELASRLDTFVASHRTVQDRR